MIQESPSAPPRKVGHPDVTEDSVIRAGVAHDIVNAVQLVTAHCELALRDAARPEHAARHMAAVRRSADLASSLCVRLMRSGLRNQNSHVRVDDAIRRVVAELSPQSDAIQLEWASSSPTVFIDVGQFSQAIRNIILNAIQASGGVSTGISIFTSIETVSCGLTRSGEKVEPLHDGAYVKIDIKDSGQGMDEALLGVIFEPGFTTKPRGSGIGLAAAIAIMRRFSGTILVHSVPGIGSTFTLLLPNSNPDVTATL